MRTGGICNVTQLPHNHGVSTITVTQ
uniref:Uncharacterized protein n=1 Tax=Anguilla anguilla TaxID=7936 RepID=A0A0E9QAJ3_ANGAN